jgi:phospholysine phosphohistidine inorganic pyrophosphate phosphatase
VKLCIDPLAGRSIEPMRLLIYIESMRGILLDMDGVLYNAEQPIEGARETVAWIQREKVPHLFVTNTTSRGRSALVQKLRRFGISAEPDRIMTPCVAAAEWLRARSAGPVALFVRPKAWEEFAGVTQLDSRLESGARYVVVGDMGEAWDFRTLNRAFRLLHSNPEAELIALGMTRYWHAEDGLRLDTAPFVAALEHASGKEPLVFGKPAEAFYRAALERLGLPESATLMIGDDIHTDIAGAQRAGLKTVLVRTGKFRPSDLEGPIVPDVVLDSIHDLPGWWESRIDS